MMSGDMVPLIALTCVVLCLTVAFFCYGGPSQNVDYFKLTGVPPPKPLPDFKIETAKARPYRPFRWEYHQNMALKKLEPDWWLELESTYVERIKQRKELVQRHGKMIVDALPGSEAACSELKAMVIQFLCARYPNQFQYEDRTGTFHNQILDIHTDAKNIDPFQFLLDHVPEDFIITQEDKRTGLYIFTAGIACSALGWNLSTKIGKPLREIHGPVPDYKEQIQMSVDRYFTKLLCDKPIQRGSWTLEIGQPLFVPPEEQRAANFGVEDIHLRVDWQTLRRLPKSRAIAFNYKALFTPVTEFREEPYIPKLVAKILRGAKPKYLEYKGTRHIEQQLLPALDLWAKEQEEKGWVTKDWKERTLDEDPFYPGWKSKYV